MPCRLFAILPLKTFRAKSEKRWAGTPGRVGAGPFAEASVPAVRRRVQMGHGADPLGASQAQG
jgi:hypothetical protein